MADGSRHFSDMPGDKRRRWHPDEGVTVLRDPSNKCNGMTRDNDGNLIVCEHVTSSVVRERPDGARETLATHWGDKELNSPNDVVVASDGSIIFTDPTYGRMPGFGVERPQDLDFQGVYRIPAGGGDLQLLIDDFAQPNGLCFTPDESQLYINDTVHAHIPGVDVGLPRADEGRRKQTRLYAVGRTVDSIEPKAAALVIQDLQNDVIIEGGAFADSGAPAHATSQNVVENVKGLAGACRKAGVPVIHVWYVVEPGAAGLKQNAPLFQGVKDSNALVRGRWGAAPAEGLEPQDGDHVVEKMRMNGFYDTKLDTLLRGFGVETLIITGAWTNMSIEHTARHAADAGYRAVVASDGTSTVNDDWQNAALSYAMQNVASVATCAEIAEAIGATVNA